MRLKMDGIRFGQEVYISDEERLGTECMQYIQIYTRTCISSILMKPCLIIQKPRRIVFRNYTAPKNNTVGFLSTRDFYHFS